MYCIRVLVSCFAACFLATPSYSAVFLSQDAVDQGEILGRDAFFDKVGFVRQVNPEGGGLALGSAVLIDKSWILTVGHVAYNGGTNLRQNLGVSFVDSIFPNTFETLGVAAIDLVIVGDEYSENFPPGIGNDIALMRLVEPIHDIEPASRFRGVDQIGTHVRTVGYGAPGVWPDEGLFDGVKRAGENVIEQFGLAGFDPQFAILEFDRFSNRLPQEWSSSQFDSGGGWFNDNNELVALTNFSAANSFFSGGIRISLYNDWIDATIAANSVPEPNSFSLVAIGVGIYVNIKNRKRICS